MQALICLLLAVGSGWGVCICALPHVLGLERAGCGSEAGSGEFLVWHFWQGKFNFCHGHFPTGGIHWIQDGYRKFYRKLCNGLHFALATKSISFT